MDVRLFKKFLWALVDTASKNLDQTTLSQITPAQLMRKAATERNTQVTLSGKTPKQLAMGRRPRDLMDPTSMNPEQLASTPTKQDLVNEEIQKLAMKNRLVGDAEMHKGLLNRESLRAEDGVKYFRDTLRPHFIKGAQSVFLMRFYQFVRARRGDIEIVKYIGKFSLPLKRLRDA